MSNPLGRARNASTFRAFLFLLPAVCAVSGHAQTNLPVASVEADATISVDVRLVVLRASVRNKDGQLASGLSQNNFIVWEDGQPQTIRTFSQEDVPLAVGLVVDNSGSMKNKRADVTAAAVAFARTSNQDDDIFVVNFNDRVTMDLPDQKLFSSAAAELEKALLLPPPEGRTALYDAIGTALERLRQSGREKKVLVVISDGGDNASGRTLNQVMQQIRRSDTTIFTIGVFDQEDTDRNPGVLRQIAGASGGEAFLPQKTADTVRVCEYIARDIRNQYTISYSPSNQNFDGRYRTIKVGATGERGAKLRVKTRPGYIASPNGDREMRK